MNAAVTSRRRLLIAGLPAAAAALTVPAAAGDGSLPRLVEELEAWQGWEPASTAAAKGFAAWRMRLALGLALPDPWLARMHVEHQHQRFEEYRRSHRYELDLRDGKVFTITHMEQEMPG